MDESDVVSRRRFLTRGAVVGGALIWAIPSVQVLSTGRAFAATGSAKTAVLGESAANGGALPFTGPQLPVVPALEVGGGLVATGALLCYLAGRPDGLPVGDDAYGA